MYPVTIYPGCGMQRTSVSGSHIAGNGAVGAPKQHKARIMIKNYTHRYLLLALQFLLICPAILAQTSRPLVSFKNYGGSNADNAGVIKNTPDGGRIMCGTTTSNNFDVSGLHGTANDIWVVKLDKAGVIQWQKTYETSIDETGQDIVTTADGGYAILAITNNFTSTADALVIKINSTGTQLWRKQFGASGPDRPTQIAETNDGGFAVVGSTIGTPNLDFAGQTNKGGYDLFISKLNSSGTLLWTKILGGTQDERSAFVRQLADGNILAGSRAVSDNGDVVGNHNNYDSGDFWILKVTQSGQIIWKKCYGGSGDETPYNMVEKSNRYYLIGTTNNLSRAASGDVNGVIDAYDMWMLVLDTAGTIVRQKCIGGTSSVDFGLGIEATLDNKFIIGGYTQSNDVYVSGNQGLTDYALIKVDSMGALVWGKLFGGSGYDFAKSVVVNPDSTYSLLCDAQNIGGDITTLYGSSDFFLVNYADTSLYPDLYAKITGPATVYTGNSVKYMLRFGKRTVPVATDTVVLYFVKNGDLSLSTTSRPVSATNGDTLFWKLPKANILSADSISLKFLLSNTAALNADSIRVWAGIGPFTTEFFQADNSTTHAAKARYQNAAIISPFIFINTTNTVVATGKTYSYTIPYTCTSLLDSTKGTVSFIADPGTRFVSSNPAYNRVSGDTLIWNFSVTGNLNGSISVVLQVKDTPAVQLNSVLTHKAILKFTTIDTAVLQRTATRQQTVTTICVTPGTANTTLPPPQGIQWLRTFGGTDEDGVYDLAAVSDTSYVALMSSASNDGDAAGAPGDFNGYAVKYLADGTQVWKTLIGGDAYDGPNSLVKGANGSVIIAGETFSTNGAFSGNHGRSDVLLTKLDSAGNLVWQKLYGGSRYDERPVIRKVADNKYIVMASTISANGNVVNPYPNDTLNAHIWLFAINESGNILWQKVYPDTLFSDYSAIQPTLDKGFIMSGTKSRLVNNSFVVADGRLVKTDSVGNILFVKSYSNEQHAQEITTVVANADSSFTFAGYTYPFLFNAGDSACIGDHGGNDIWVAKTDKNGTRLWQQFYGGTRDEYAFRLIPAAGGGYLVLGNTNSNDGNVTNRHNPAGTAGDAWLVRLDNNGNLLWQKTVGGDDEDDAYTAIQLPSSDFIIGGDARSQNNGDVYNSKGYFDGILFKIGAANYIRGSVYADNNGNHIRDAGEPYFTAGTVKSSKGTSAGSSDIVEGAYANSVDTGRYVTQPVIASPYYNAFPLADTSVFTSYLQTDTVDFAMVPVPGINDLRLSLIPLTAARPGFPAACLIRYENVGTTTIAAGNVSLVKDPRVTVDSASVPYTSFVADTLRWAFTNFAPMQTREFKVYLKLAIPPALNNGDTLRYTATVNPLAGDSTPVNNSVSLRQLVTGSYDPNDKTETHGPGFPAQLLANGEYLNYIIRFQNTGTDTAFRVLVRDTLDAKLNWSSLEMIDASHPYQLSIASNNQLEWKFDPIILPDSNTNLAGSQGYIAYRIKPLATLAEGDTISNRAGIYFDFNLPIITNRHQTIIDKGVSICPGTSTVYSAGVPGGTAYRWQVNTGSGFTDISNGGVYSGAATDKLQLTTPPTSFAGYQYRCVVTTAGGTVNSAAFVLKFSVSWTGLVSTDWSTPGNWNCGILPDAYTDVVINSGAVLVNSNATIRSLTLKPGVQFLIAGSRVFTVTH